MSLDYSANVLYGVKADDSEFAEKKTIPGCEHAPETPFCPECGMPKMIEVMTEIDGLNENKSLFYGLEIHCSMGGRQERYIGVLLAGTSSSRTPADHAKPFHPVGFETEEKVRQSLTGTKFADRPMKYWVILHVGY